MRSRDRLALCRKQGSKKGMVTIAPTRVPSNLLSTLSKDTHQLVLEVLVDLLLLFCHLERAGRNGTVAEGLCAGGVQGPAVDAEPPRERLGAAVRVLLHDEERGAARDSGQHPGEVNTEQEGSERAGMVVWVRSCRRAGCHAHLEELERRICAGRRWGQCISSKTAASTSLIGRADTKSEAGLRKAITTSAHAGRCGTSAHACRCGITRQHVPPSAIMKRDLGEVEHIRLVSHVVELPIGPVEGRGELGVACEVDPKEKACTREQLGQVVYPCSVYQGHLALQLTHRVKTEEFSRGGHGCGFCVNANVDRYTELCEK